MNYAEACNILRYEGKDLDEIVRKAKIRSHPDRGGSADEFCRVCEAESVIRNRPPKYLSSWDVQKMKVGVETNSEWRSFMNESKFSQKLNKKLEAAGAMVLKIHGHGMQEAGWPDLQVYHPVWTGHLELKMKNGYLSELQKDRIENLRKRGVKVWVLFSWDDDLQIGGWTFPEWEKKDGRQILTWLSGLTR